MFEDYSNQPEPPNRLPSDPNRVNIMERIINRVEKMDTEQATRIISKLNFNDKDLQILMGQFCKTDYDGKILFDEDGLPLLKDLSKGEDRSKTITPSENRAAVVINFLAATGSEIYDITSYLAHHGNNISIETLYEKGLLSEKLKTTYLEQHTRSKPPTEPTG